MTRVMNMRPSDCLSCRLVSGFGLIGAGLYVAGHGRTAKHTTGKFAFMSFAAVLCYLGGVRLLKSPVNGDPEDGKH